MSMYPCNQKVCRVGVYSNCGGRNGRVFLPLYFVENYSRTQLPRAAFNLARALGAVRSGGGRILATDGRVVRPYLPSDDEKANGNTLCDAPPRDVNPRVIAVCRQISEEADAMREKARWSGRRMGDQIMVGRRGIAEGIVGDHLSLFSSDVAKGNDLEAAYKAACDGLRHAIKRFNAQTEWQCRRSEDCGQDTLQYAFWRLRDAEAPK